MQHSRLVTSHTNHTWPWIVAICGTVLVLFACPSTLDAFHQPAPTTTTASSEQGPDNPNTLSSKGHVSMVRAQYIKGQLIVKYKDSVTHCVHCLLKAGKKAFKDATIDHSDSL